jgi:hypothetical protein
MRSEIGSSPAFGFAEDAWTDLPLHAWEALPLPGRVQHRLAEIIVVVDDLRADLHSEAAGALRWDAEVERISESVESLLDRLAC